MFVNAEREIGRQDAALYGRPEARRYDPLGLHRNLHLDRPFLPERGKTDRGRISVRSAVAPASSMTTDLSNPPRMAAAMAAMLLAGMSEATKGEPKPPGIFHGRVVHRLDHRHGVQAKPLPQPPLQIVVARLVFRHRDADNAAFPRQRQQPRDFRLGHFDELGDFDLAQAIEVIKAGRQPELLI